MKVHLIKERISEYVNALKKLEYFPEKYYWENHQNFQSSWDIEALDFDTMFDHSFSSKISLRLWKHENYFPKEIMRKFISHDKEFVRTIFRDLLNEEKDLNMRVNRFVLYCDELLMILQKKTSKAADHFHHDQKMIFNYLAFSYPEDYVLYDFEKFAKTMQLFQARNIPRMHDPELFTKMMKAIRLFLSKDESFLQLKNQFSDKEGIDLNELSFWVYDFYTREY